LLWTEYKLDLEVILLKYVNSFIMSTSSELLASSLHVLVAV